MVRFLIIGIVIAVAFTLYALVDAAMTDGSRARGVSKPVWVVVIVLLPVIGGILWFLIGKGATPATRPQAPDDDPRFSGTRMSSVDLDDHMRDLEDRLRELDDEVFPGEPDEPGDAPRTGASGETRGRPAAGPASPSDEGDETSPRPGDVDPTATDAETTTDGDSGAAQK
jgi:hypothetical protein